LGKVDRAAQAAGFSSASAFMRAAIERELIGSKVSGDDSADRVVASLDRVARELRGVRLAQQALFAFVDALAKIILTCVPEPPQDAREQAVARAKARYERLMKIVGTGMKGDAQAALTELSGNVDAD
jgi:hypothetical protein